MSNSDRDGDDEREREQTQGSLARAIGRVEQFLPWFIRQSYLLKFSLALVLVVGLIATVGYVAYAETNSTLNEQVSEQLTTEAKREAENIQTWRDQHKLWLNGLSKTRVMQTTGVYLPISKSLQQEGNVPEDVRAVHFINLQTTQIKASSNSRKEGSRLSETNATWTDLPLEERLASSDDVLISEVYRESGIPVVAFVTEIPERSGVGLVAIVEQNRLLTKVSGESKRFVSVVNAEGKIVMDRRGDAKVGKLYGEGEIGDVLEKNSSEYLGAAPNQNTLNESYVAAFAPVNGTGWAVISHAPKDEAFLVRNRITSRLIQIIVVSLVGLALIGLVIGGGTVRSLERLTTKAKALEEGDLDVSLSASRDDEIGRLYESFANMRDSLRRRITQAEEALEDAEQARTDAENARHEAEKAREQAQEMNEHLEQKANEYREAMEACASGDLTRRLDPESESEAMEEIAAAFNEMMDDIERTVATVSEFATSVSTAGEELSASSDDLEQTSDTVSSAITHISQYATEQNDRIQTVSREIQDMSAVVEEMAATAENVAQTSEQAAAYAEEGIDAAENVVTEMDQIESRANQTLAEINELDEAMEEIGEVVDVITEIADQTNMLALNANIEAARAGSGGDGTESGEGFAVVANEVKQLSEETKESAERIATLVENVQSQTDATVEEMSKMQESVISGAETIQDSVTAFEGIDKQVEEANDGVQEINTATDDVADSIQELVAMSDEVSETSEQTAHEADDAAAVTEEQTAAITEVSQSATNLDEQARQLQDLLDQFTTAAEALEDTASLGGDTPEAPVEAATSASTNGGEHDPENDPDDGEFVFGDEATGEETNVTADDLTDAAEQTSDSAEPGHEPDSDEI